MTLVRTGVLLRTAQENLSEDGWRRFCHEIYPRVYGTRNHERRQPLWESRFRELILIADRYCRTLDLYTLRRSPYLRMMSVRRSPGTRGRKARRIAPAARVWCPLCCQLYPSSRTNKEHVPPKSLGGIRRVRVCKECNELTGIYDNYTAQSIHGGSVTTEALERVSCRPVTAKDEVVRSDTNHKFTLAIDPHPAWQLVQISKKYADTLREDNATLSLLTPGFGQSIGLPVPPGAPFIVRLDELDYVTSYAKAAYLLVVLLLGRLGASYARWCDAIRSLLTGTGRYSGEPRTAGGDVARYVPILDNMWPDKREKVGFSLRHRLWLVIVRDQLVVLPSYDPNYSCQQAMFLRMQYLPLNESASSMARQLATVNPHHILWFDYPKTYGTASVKYIGVPAAKGYPFGAKDDLVGSIVRAPDSPQRDVASQYLSNRYTHYAVLHQHGRSLAVTEVGKKIWQDFCHDRATRHSDQQKFDRPYPYEPGRWYPESIVRNRPFSLRQHYAYRLVL